MSRDDSGFTLVELLIAVVVLSLLSLAATFLLITVLKLNVETTTGVAGARSTELTIAYYNDDLRNATAVAGPSTIPAQASQTCGSGDALILEVTGSTFSAAGTVAPIIVSYVRRPAVVDDGATRTQLHRLSCATASATAGTDIVLDTLISTTPAGDGATCTVAAAPLWTRSCTMTTTPCPPDQLAGQSVPKCTTTNPGTQVVPTTTYSVKGTTRTNP